MYNIYTHTERERERERARARARERERERGHRHSEVARKGLGSDAGALEHLDSVLGIAHMEDGSLDAGVVRWNQPAVHVVW
jgi:hypothetical protein